jgi:hypothetical protein
MVNIAFDVLGFFMVSLRIKDVSLSPLLEEYNNRLVVDLRDIVSLVIEPLDELPEGLSLLVDDTG